MKTVDLYAAHFKAFQLGSAMLSADLDKACSHIWIERCHEHLTDLANVLGCELIRDPHRASLQKVEQRLGASIDKSLGNMAARAQQASHLQRQLEEAQRVAAEAQRDLARERETAALLREEVEQLTAKRRAFA